MPGCVRRRLMIRSNPPGAMVYVDNQPIGTTPCATSFVYYGTREIRLVKPGYETLTVNQPIPTPWYQWPGIDFISENVVPREIQDFRTVSFNLTPQVIVPTDQLIARGEQLRAATQQGAVAPAGGALPWSTTVVAPPTMATPAPANTVGPLFPGVTLTPEAVPPGVIVPPSSGAGVLPPGGRALTPLPTP
ncbi:MAG: PEGA domain-containing protein [Pirellulales bacterium]|nr:PEGA domain-containing protein [Pirellulales bacterium]